MPKKKKYQRIKSKSKSKEKNQEKIPKISNIENEEYNSTDKNNNEFNDIEEEEINDLQKDLKCLKNDSSYSNEEENEEIYIKEDEEEPFEDFSRGEEINDIQYIKEDLDKIRHEKNNLNYPNNPFIKENKKLKINKNNLEQKLHKKKENEKKEIKIQDIEMNEISNDNLPNENKDKHYINDIFIYKSNKIYNENNNIIYNTLFFAGKKYKIMAKSSKISETNEITYYCTLHRTIKNSQEYYDNNKKKK